MSTFSLPARGSEYVDERRGRGRESPRWHAHKKHSSKRDHHYKKHCKYFYTSIFYHQI